MFKGLLTILVISLTMVSCQEDTVSENTEALSNTSQLTHTLLLMSANETANDNVIDSVDCFNVKLPVQVIVNGQQLLVTNEAGYATVQSVIDQNPDDEDEISFVFPITVVYTDYEEVTVNTAQEYQTLAGFCQNVPEYIENDCISLVFPITIYGYNSGFQMQETYVLNNNAELYAILQNLGSNQYYSINYPVSLNAGGTEVTVGNNSQFLEAVTSALESCEEDGCDNPGILINDLLIYMPFSNGVVQDLKGNAVTAPLDITFTADRNGNQNCAIVFNGTQFLHMPKNNSNGIIQGNAFSVSLWFRMQNTVEGDLENLFTKGNINGQGFALSVYDLNTPLFVAGTADIWDNAWNSSATLPVDTINWHHLVATVDAANTLKLYRDGALRNTAEFSTGHISNDTLDYYIGNNFKGFMDDLRVYKKTLSPQEVQTLFELEGDCSTCLE